MLGIQAVARQNLGDGCLVVLLLNLQQTRWASLLQSSVGLNPTDYSTFTGYPVSGLHTQDSRRTTYDNKRQKAKCALICCIEA